MIDAQLSCSSLRNIFFSSLGLYNIITQAKDPWGLCCVITLYNLVEYQKHKAKKQQTVTAIELYSYDERVYLSVRSHLKNHTADLHHFLIMLTVAVSWFFCGGVAMQYVFLVLWMMSRFHIMDCAVSHISKQRENSVTAQNYVTVFVLPYRAGSHVVSHNAEAT